MVQTVTRTFDENHVPLRIDIRPKIKQDFPAVVNIHVFIHRHNDLREHHLARTPQTMHQLERLVRVLFFQAHKGQIMKNPFRRERQIHQLGKIHFQDGQKNPHAGRSQPEILHRRLSHHRGRIDRIFSVSDGRDPESGILVHRSVKSRMISKGSFRHRLSHGIHGSLNDKVGIGRHLDRLAHRRDKRDGFLPQKSGEHVLVNPIGQRGRGRKRIGRIPTQSHRNGHRLAHFPVFFSMPRSDLVQLPVQRRFPRAEHLDAVHPDVPLLGFRIFGDDLGQSEKRSPIFGPSL